MRLTLPERGLLVQLGWQAECAEQVGASHLVDAFSATRDVDYDTVPDSFIDCVLLGRSKLRRHLASIRGDSDRTSDPKPIYDLAQVGGEPVGYEVGYREISKLRAMDALTELAAKPGGGSSRRSGWAVAIETEFPPTWPVTWSVKIWSPTSWHRYIGTDLALLISRAHAGEPGDE